VGSQSLSAYADLIQASNGWSQISHSLFLRGPAYALVMRHTQRFATVVVKALKRHSVNTSRTRLCPFQRFND